MGLNLGYSLELFGNKTKKPWKPYPVDILTIFGENACTPFIAELSAIFPVITRQVSYSDAPSLLEPARNLAASAGVEPRYVRKFIISPET